MDSFPEDSANIPIHFYGSTLDSNEDDNEEEVDVTTEVRYFKSPLHTAAVLTSCFVTAPKLFLSFSGNRESKSQLHLYRAMCTEERKRSVLV